MSTDSSKAKKGMSYKECGVNIDEGNRFVSKIKKVVTSWHRPEVMRGIGGFGGLFDISKFGYKEPILVTSIDGVGTKLSIAMKMNKHDTVGMDIVNHCVNDILVQGAKPLYFTDYIGTGKLNADKMEEVIKGMHKACREANCELIGGETAEMPGMYNGEDYDLVGAITGIVEKSKLISGDTIRPGDVLLSLPSTGLHTNGYSLARKVVFDKMKFTVDTKVDELEHSVGETLLVPHRCYGPIMYDLLEKFEIKGMAHITGGGITENLPRIFPEGIGAEVEISKIKVLPIFQCIQEWGNIEKMEMFRVFNMGVGMILVISKEESEKVLRYCKKIYGDSSFIGHIIPDVERKVRYI